MKWTVVVVAALLAGAVFAQKADDEKIIRNLEQEWVTHVGSSQADIDFAKRVLPDKEISIDTVGRIYPLTISDVENMAKADPEVKSSGEVKNLKIQFFGSDTAIATYNVHFLQTGHKDKKFNLDVDMACLDVWYKIHGQWKAVGGTNTSTKPLPSEMYKMEMTPGMPAPIS